MKQLRFPLLSMMVVMASALDAPEALCADAEAAINPSIGLIREVEEHRGLQDRSKSSLSLIPKYEKLKTEHPESAAYAYLRARIEPNVKTRFEMAKELIQKWPDFAYSHHFMGFVVGYEQFPANYEYALKEFKVAQGLFSELKLGDAIQRLELAIQVQKKARSIALTYNAQELNRYSTRKVEVQSRDPASIKARYYQNEFIEKKWTMVAQPEAILDLRYVGPATQLTHYPKSWPVKELEPGFEYEIALSKPLNLKLKKVGAREANGRYPDIYLSHRTFQQGKARIFLTAQDVQEMQSLELVELGE